MRPRKRRGLGALALAVAALLALVTSWRPPGPATPADEVAGLERFAYAAPGGLRVSALRAGPVDGRRIILVHGTPGAAAGWADYLRQPLSGMEVVAVDRPGFGDTRPDDAEPSLARQAAALRPLLHRTGGEAAVLVGHSLGGPVVAQAAADYPDRVGALVIVAGALDPGQERIHPMQRVGEWPGVRAMLPRTLRNANRELLPLKRELERLAPRLATIAKPVVVVHGTADRLVPYANATFMRARFVQARFRLVQLDGQDHFLPWSHRPLIELAIREAANS